MANFGHLLAHFPSRKHSHLTMGLDMFNNSMTGYQSANSVLLAVDLAIRHTDLFLITTQRDNQLILRLDKSFIENRSTQICSSPDFLTVGYF